jgi:hypothetical protein
MEPMTQIAEDAFIKELHGRLKLLEKSVGAGGTTAIGINVGSYGVIMSLEDFVLGVIRERSLRSISFAQSYFL